MAAPTGCKMAAAALEPLLTELLEPDSAGIRQATARLREALQEPEAPRGLAVLLREAERPQVRHLAALLLRRLLRKLPPELLQRLPQVLVEALEQETDPPTRGALGQLGARLLLLGGPRLWEPLQGWMQEAARDPQKREGALRCLGVALGVAGPALSRRGPALAGLCRWGLGAANSAGTLGAALAALGALAAALGGTRTELLRSLVPDILRALQELLNMDEDCAANALEVLDEFLEANPESLIPHLRPMLELCLQVAGDESRGDAVRVRALATVTFLAQKRPRALLRGGLLALVLRGLLVPLCAELRPENPDPEENWDEAEGGEGPCPRHAAAQALDALAQGLPPEKLLKELLPLLEGPSRSAAAGGRKGALLALAALARGCGATLRQRFLGPVLGALRGGLGDPEAAVRGAAAAALRELREELEPELAQLAAEALPALLGGFWGSPSSPEPRDWFVLEALLEALGEGVQPWLPQLLPKILEALEPSGSPRSRELALSALHALGCGCSSLPSPLGPALLGAVTALSRGGPHQLQALEVLGALGPAVVGEGLLEALERGLGLARPEEPEATRVSLVLAAAVSELLGEGAAPLLPRVLPVLQGALRPPASLPPSEAPDWLLHLHDDDDDEEGAEPMEDDVTELEVGGAFPGLAEAALGALGEIAENCGAAFLPYVDSTLAAILDLTEFPQCQVRAAAYEALGSLCRCGRGREPQTAPTPGQQGALRALLEGLRREPEVGGALGAVGGAGRLLQPPGHAPPEWLQPIGQALADVITGEIRCLRRRGADGAQEETSQLAELREAASDWLPELGVAMARAGLLGTGNGRGQTGNDVSMAETGVAQTGSEIPNTGNGFPDTGSGFPNSGSGFSNTGNGFPNTGSGFPNTGNGFPNTGSGFPNTGNGFPNTGSGFPNTGSGFPNTGNGSPNTGSASQDTGNASPNPGRGVAFPPRLFRRLLPSLLAALADPAHPGARSWAAAVIGQLGHALGPEATPFLPDLGPAFRLAAADPEPEVRSNAFYAIGRIGEAVGHAHREGAWPGAELCGRALREGGEGPGRVRDNAVGALVRQQGAPFEEVLPLVLGALPLSEDLEEEEPVLRFLLGAGPERLLPHLPELVRGLGPALARLDSALSQSLLALLRQVGGADPRRFRVGVASLDPAHAAILARLLEATPPGQE
ncbi:importin-4 [Aphelocoma coerulescens]|uniref:importin-4 n=1 Tax=Aphelocoma coerulescens TaxID=39617 RepID=UPI00360518E8